MSSDRDELEALEGVNAVLEQAKRAQRSERRSITQLLGAWEQFVQSVDAGYDWSIYEYTNDLSVRDQIAEVLSVLKPGSLQWISDSVAAVDARFRDVTRELDRPLQSGADRGWWWRRVPSRPGEELAADLAVEGL
jgi:hypothetical protein